MSYFKPWRRKLGIVTLLLASSLTAGWVRSLTIGDRLEVGERIFISLSGQFGIEKKVIEFDGSCTGTVIQTEWAAPYVHIVAPLTVISAYLLLSRPWAKATPMVAPNPTVVESV